MCSSQPLGSLKFIAFHAFMLCFPAKIIQINWMSGPRTMASVEDRGNERKIKRCSRQEKKMLCMQGLLGFACLCCVHVYYAFIIHFHYFCFYRGSLWQEELDSGITGVWMMGASKALMVGHTLFLFLKAIWLVIIQLICDLLHVFQERSLVNPKPLCR